jgi:hypothetical protein
MWNGTVGVIVDGFEGGMAFGSFLLLFLLPGPLCWHSPLLLLCVLPL